MVINASKQQTRDSAFLKYIIAIMISIFPYLLYAQSYKGTVVDMQNNPVAFANITTLTTDSTFITGTVSNDDGSFQINANSTVALLKISYIGYQELILPVSMDKTELGTIQLEDGNLRLDEVVVEANLNKVFGERREFLFSPDDKLKANSGLDLMRNVPQLSLNDMTNKLQTANGGTVKVLLNGLMVEETDLIGLRPEDIIKVEYYSQPPARYANLGVDAVLNVVVRRSDNGGYIMANIRQGLTTGFGTDIIQGKLSKGDNDYSLRYFLDYRDLNKNRYHQSYAYSLNDGNYDIHKEGLNGDYSGTYHVIEGNFARIKNENYFLNIKGSLRLNPGNENYPSSISGFRAGLPIETGISISKAHSNYLSPALDIYFSKTMKNDQELTFNVVNTYYDSKSDRSLNENFGSHTYDVATSFRNKSYSIISEAVYEKNFGKHAFSVGAKHSFKTLSEDYTAGDAWTNSHYDIHNLYGYLSLSSHFDKWHYNIGFGVEETWLDAEQKQTYFVVKPNLLVSYNYSDQSTWELKSAINSYVPDISLLSSSPVFIDSSFVSQGNPNLKPYYEVTADLSYTYSKGSFYLQTGVGYSYSHNPYHVYFDNDGLQALKSYRHEDYLQSYNYNLTLSWNPFPWLTLAPTYMISYQKSKGPGFSYDNWMHYSSFYASASYKDFSLTMQVFPKYKNLQGQTISRWENYYYGDIRWQKKNLSVTLGVLFSSKANTLFTCNGAPIRYFETQDWHNFNGLVFANLVYTFSFGKNKNRNVQQKLKNADNDSGLYQDSKARF